MHQTVFENEKHKSTVNEYYLDEQTHWRFASPKAAEKVANVLRSITTGLKIYVRHLPVNETDRIRGVGDYAITTFRRLDCFATSRFCHAIEQAQSLVLADDIAEYDPEHPLLKNWSFKPENRNKLSKIHFGEKDFSKT